MITPRSSRAALMAASLGLTGPACTEGASPSGDNGRADTTDNPSSGPATPPGASTSGPADPTRSGAGLDSSGGATSTGLTEGADSTGDEPEVFDCNDAPETFASVEHIDGPRGYHGLEITPDGRMIGSDGASLIQSYYDGDWSVAIPGLGEGEQMDWLADGDLAYALSDSITRVRLDGTTDVIAPSMFVYGLNRGPDDMLYVAGYGTNTVQRVDPATGDAETVITFEDPQIDTHATEFSPDGRRLYIGTIGDGTLYYVDLDQSMNPTGEPMVLSDRVGADFGETFEGWHDAVAVDACGNVYVPDFYSSTLFRIAPDGTTTAYWEPAVLDEYAHGLLWGTGEHGWKRDALYFPQPYNGNRVGEIVVGVPPRDFEGTVLNAPPMK